MPTRRLARDTQDVRGLVYECRVLTWGSDQLVLTLASATDTRPLTGEVTDDLPGDAQSRTPKDALA